AGRSTNGAAPTRSSRKTAARAERVGAARLTGAGADDGNRLDLHEQLRIDQRAHLDEGRAGKVAGEELAPRARYLHALRDVGGEDAELDDIVHGAAGRLDQMADAPQHLARLLIG